MATAQKWLEWAGGKQAIYGTVHESRGGAKAARCTTRSAVSTDDGIDRHYNARRERRAAST
jgi:hypothetical protein